MRITLVSLCTLFLLCSQSLLPAQQSFLQYKDVATIGGGAAEQHFIQSIKADADENVYALGSYSGVVIFPTLNGPLYASGSYSKLYLAKFDSTNTVIWIRFLQSYSSGVEGLGLERDPSGNLLISGAFLDSLLPDPSNSQTMLRAIRGKDGFLAKFSPSGDFLWAHAVSGPGAEAVHAITTNSQGEIYITGAFEDSVDFDFGPGANLQFASPHGPNPFLAKYDSSGQLIWANSLYGFSGGSFGKALALDSQEEILLSGDLLNSVDFDPGPGVFNLSSQGFTDGFFAKYSATGNFRWAKSIQGNLRITANDIAFGLQDEIFITGKFRDTADFDPGPGVANMVSAGNSESLFLSKYDSAGNYLNAFSILAIQQVVGNQVEVDPSGNLYLAGQLGSTTDFDPGPGTYQVPANSINLFVASYDSAFNLRWVNAPNNSLGGDNCRGLARSPNGMIIGAGGFASDLDLDPDTSSFWITTTSYLTNMFLTRHRPADGGFISGLGGGLTYGGDDNATHILRDGQGNFYVCGDFTGEVDFDTSASSFNVLDTRDRDRAFVAKFNPAVGLIWLRSFEGNSVVTAERMTLDSSGNLFVGGFFRDSVDFDPGPGKTTLYANSYDGFVVKMDDQGNFIWARVLTGPGYDLLYDLATDSWNNVYVTGYSQTSIDLDPGPGQVLYTSSGRDAYLVKLDSNGMYAWGFGLGSGSDDFGNAVKCDQAGNVYLGGSFRQSMDFDPDSASAFNLSPYGDTDAFLAKYDSSGDLVFAKQYGGPSNDLISRLAIEPNGTCYAVGRFSGSADFDPGFGTLTRTAQGNVDLFAMKVSPAGNTLWAGSYGSYRGLGYPFTNEWVRDVVLDGRRLLMCGFVTSAGDFDPDTSVASTPFVDQHDAFVNVWDTSGYYLEAASWGGTLLDNATGVTAVGGDIFVSGYFERQVDFDPGAGTQIVDSKSNARDMFILRLGDADTCQVSPDTIVYTGCLVYIAPSGRAYSRSGTYIDIKPNPGFCDSVFVLQLNITPPIIGDTTLIRDCYSYFDSLTASTITQSGVYARLFQTPLGCDSLAFLDVRLDTSSSFAQINACGSYNWNGLQLSISGLYVDTLVNMAGCDSLLSLDLTVRPNSFTNFSVTTCDTFVFGGTTLNQAGTYQQYLVNSSGCDSIVTLNLSIQPPSVTVSNGSACDSLFWNGNWYAATGTYRDTVQTGAGCDSILELNLNLLPKKFYSFSASACDSFTYRGNTFYSSGSYQDTLAAWSGCDSIVTLNLTINHPVSSAFSDTACTAYTWGVTGQTYTASGAYQGTLTASTGCDSVVTLNLTIFQPVISQDTVSPCDFFYWPVTGQTYITSGTYRGSLTAANGCDSIIDMTVVIRPSYTQIISVSACNDYFWSATGQTYTTSGSRIGRLTTSQGCDSVITLNLTILNVDTSVSVNQNTLTANAVGAAYQWLDCQDNYRPLAGANSRVFSPLINGRYAVKVTANQCVDTSGCYSVVLTGAQASQQGHQLNVFPNPGTGLFTVSASKLYQDMRIEVTDARGRLVLQRPVGTLNKFDVFIPGSEGVYFLHVFDVSGVVGHFRLLKTSK